MLSSEYKHALKARVVQQFVHEHDRAPSKTELLALMNREEKRYPTLDAGGFAAFDAASLAFSEPSSALKENALRAAAFDDLQVMNRKLVSLQEQMEMSFRGLYASASRVSRELDALEARMDNLILLNESSDLFVYGVEESFDIQDKIDWDNTTASVESNYCTIGHEHYGAVVLKDVLISSVVTSERGYLSVQGTAGVEHLKQADGVFYEQLVYTDYNVGRVTLTLDIELPEPQDLQSFKLTCTPVQVNNQMTCTLWYSTDGRNYDAIEPVEIPVRSENVFSVPVEQVQKLRLTLSKSAADTTTTTARQHVYIFSLDSIQIYSSGYAQAGDLVLQAGPYEIRDEEGAEVNFSRATVETCTRTPGDTSVSMYLSNDGVTWHGVSSADEGSAVAVFESSAQTDTYVLIDEALGTQDLVSQVPGVDIGPGEAALNMAVGEDYRTRLIKKSISIRRGVGTDPVHDAPPGWEKRDGLMSTCIYVANPEGVYLDLGHTGAFVNDNPVTGRVFLASGYQRFSTSLGNFQEVDGLAQSIRILRRQDPLYPYNHRYLVEGYTYPSSFSGEILYPGVGENFTSLLSYCTPEEFADPENEQNLGIYTLDETTDTPVFKVKVRRDDSTWEQEKFAASWLISGTVSNRIWVRAVLQAYDNTGTPVLESYKVRVI